MSIFYTLAELNNNLYYYEKSKFSKRKKIKQERIEKYYRWINDVP